MNSNNGFSPMDMWRLCSDYSVADAAILITGKDPANPAYRNERWRHYEDKCIGFAAAFSALKNAIIANKIKSLLVYESKNNKSEENDESSLLLCTDSVEYIEILSGSKSAINDNGWKSRKIRIIARPDWNETLISKDDLKELCASAGLYPSFLFPNEKNDGASDKTNPRYSNKLSCALAAWNAYDPRKYKSSSVKESIKKWVRANAVTYDLLNENGEVPRDVADGIAYVVNWDTKGGAPKTGGAVSETSPQVPRDPPQNYERTSPTDLFPDAELDPDADFPF